MTALILPFPNFFRPATPQDEPGVIMDFPAARMVRVEIVDIERECPKVQELRRQSKRLREYFKPKRSN